MCNETVASLGFDWLLLFLRPNVHSSTSPLAIHTLLHLVLNPGYSLPRATPLDDWGCSLPGGASAAGLRSSSNPRKIGSHQTPSALGLAASSSAVGGTSGWVVGSAGSGSSFRGGPCSSAPTEPGTSVWTPSTGQASLEAAGPEATVGPSRGTSVGGGSGAIRSVGSGTSGHSNSSLGSASSSCAPGITAGMGLGTGTGVGVNLGCVGASVGGGGGIDTSGVVAFRNGRPAGRWLHGCEVVFTKQHGLFFGASSGAASRSASRSLAMQELNLAACQQPGFLALRALLTASTTSQPIAFHVSTLPLACTSTDKVRVCSSVASATSGKPASASEQRTRSHVPSDRKMMTSSSVGNNNSSTDWPNTIFPVLLPRPPPEPELFYLLTAFLLGQRVTQLPPDLQMPNLGKLITVSVGRAVYSLRTHNCCLLNSTD
ncbi:unnamed protein product [Protopolystoma xenopodis]|uniref:Uncharacterized protein n=1 Tax=Protopolystoma xenopodis TaxID=117903 RepID=A0A448XAM4_9PLAT|nr:unnamed protein product [Protopolystoma xenopodis]